MTRRGRAPRRLPARSVQDRDWQWNHAGAGYDGVHTREGCLTWYTEAGPGGGSAGGAVTVAALKVLTGEAEAQVVESLTRVREDASQALLNLGEA